MWNENIVNNALLKNRLTIVTDMLHTSNNSTCTIITYTINIHINYGKIMNSSTHKATLLSGLTEIIVSSSLYSIYTLQTPISTKLVK